MKRLKIITAVLAALQNAEDVAFGEVERVMTWVRWNIPILVTQQTGTKLVLRTRWQPEIVFGLIAILGIIKLVSLPTASSMVLACNRTENIANCKLTEFKVFGKRKVRDLPLARLQNATVEKAIYNSKVMKPYEVYRVQLRTAEGVVPLTPYFTSDWGLVRADVASINDFMGNLQQSSLQIKPDIWSYQYQVHTIFKWLYGLAGIVFLVLFCKPRVFCTFDKSSGRVEIRCLGVSLMSRDRNAKSYDISAIKDVFVEEGTDEGGFRVSLRLDNDAIVPLISTYSSGRKNKQKAVATIQAFLAML